MRGMFRTGCKVWGREGGKGVGVWSSEVQVMRGPAAVGGAESVELTPTEPFVKGMPLPVTVEGVRLVPMR